MGYAPTPSSPLIYRNDTYGFTLAFSRWWKPYLSVDDKIYGSPQEASLTFRFRYGRNLYGPVFTLIISNLTGQAWKRYFADSPVVYLCRHNGLTFGYLLPGELPSGFLRPDRLSYDYARYRRPIRILRKLVAQVPKVLKSLHFHRSPRHICLACRPGVRRPLRISRQRSRKCSRNRSKSACRHSTSSSVPCSS